MVKKNRLRLELNPPLPDIIDCACVIHDVQYGWEYVEKLHAGLQANLTPTVRMHVYSEASRAVPHTMIHHHLEEWPGIKGPKKSWWYKVQIFNTQHHQGPLLYLDLDTVIVNNLDWICTLPLNKFWSVLDFKYLFRTNNQAINSSVMWFDTSKFHYVYQKFDPATVAKRTNRLYGDQDWLQEIIPAHQCGFFDRQKVESWRWQALDGGYDFRTRKYRTPGAGTNINNNTSILIFHGNPKPHEIPDPVVKHFWK